MRNPLAGYRKEQTNGRGEFAGIKVGDSVRFTKWIPPRIPKIMLYEWCRVARFNRNGRPVVLTGGADITVMSRGEVETQEQVRESRERSIKLKAG